MRRSNCGLVLATLLVLLNFDSSSGEPTREETPEARLKTILNAYDKASQAIREIHYHYTQTEDDPIFGTKEHATGQVFYRKPDLIRIDWKSVKGETRYFVCQDRKLHLFSIQDRTEQIFPLPKEFGFPEHPEEYPKEEFLWKVAGGSMERLAMQYLQLPIHELEKNCQIQLTTENKDWIALWIKPRTERFRTQFQQIQVVLNAKTYQVQRVWLEEPNGRRIRIEVEKAVINPTERITPESIRKGLPQGWKQWESE